MSSRGHSHDRYSSGRDPGQATSYYYPSEISSSPRQSRFDSYYSTPSQSQPVSYPYHHKDQDSYDSHRRRHYSHDSSFSSRRSSATFSHDEERRERRHSHNHDHSASSPHHHHEHHEHSREQQEHSPHHNSDSGSANGPDLKQAAGAAVVAGLVEAFTSRHDANIGSRIATAALGAAITDSVIGHHHDGKEKRHIVESALVGLVGDRAVHGRH
ncbi:hypothetical protein F5Y16DRAFT_395020 [Xylariaceae sp. FL0255]|nr:hypothetical protein F5Y16DRAFT_395020 [Xylariaceae sp. FL0255]